MSAKTVTCRGVTLGQGKPKICIPIVGTTREEILSQAENLTTLPADLAEWRCDWYRDVFSPEDFSDTLHLLRNQLGDLPLLLTFRSAREGGEKPITAPDYIRLLTPALESGTVDLLDLELSMGPDIFSTLVACAHNAGTAVIASSHDFEKTPSPDILLSRMMQMEAWGADIAKVAVMPHCPRDVVNLLQVTCDAGQCLEIPVVTMSMSHLGMVSRLSGQVFGSVMTFGSAARASAPGQVPATQLDQILTLLELK